MTHHIDGYDAYCFEQLRSAQNPELECACRKYLASEGYADALAAFTITRTI